MVAAAAASVLILGLAACGSEPDAALSSEPAGPAAEGAAVIDMPRDPRESWSDDFEGSDIGDLWRDVDGDVRIEDGVGSGGGRAACFRVEPGDVISGGERAEIFRDPGGEEDEGELRYYRWSTRFPEDWSEPEGWGIILQFHSRFGVPPPLAVNVRGDRLLLQGSGSQYDDRALYEGAEILDELELGVWHDFIMEVEWDRADGHVRVWHRLDGEERWGLRVDDDGVPNIQTDDGDPSSNYMRLGLYRGEGGDDVNEICHDDVRRTSSLADALAD